MITIRVREASGSDGPTLLLLDAIRQDHGEAPKAWAGTLLMKDKTADELKTATAALIADLAARALA